MIQALLRLLDRLMASLYPTEPLEPVPAAPVEPSVPVMPAPAPHVVPNKPAPPKPTPSPQVAPKPVSGAKLDFSTAKSAYHSTRVLCDEYGLTLSEKNVICACIYQESNFLNYRAPGKPTKFENKDEKTGHVWSTDWGIVQINDTKGWHIGPGLPFSSIQNVLDNPEKAVRYMIRMYKAGKLSLWSSYKFGHYKKWLLNNSPMWLLKK